MRVSRSVVIVAVCLGMGVGAVRVSHAAGLQLEHLRKLTRLSDPRISPDGRHIALILSTPVWKTDTRNTRLVLVDVATGHQRTLTWHRQKVSSPRWSPDGGRLAFLAKDPKTHHVQIFVMPMDGGDALRITSAKEGVDTFSWSPDGTRIAFIAEDGPLDEKAIEQHDKVFHVTDGNFLLRKAVAPFHLWVVSSGGGQPHRLTRGSFSLDTDQGGATAPSWSADGKRIAFTRYPSAYWGPSFHSVIAVVDAGGGPSRVLVRAEGANTAVFAPHAAACAFLRPRNGDENNGTAVYVHTGTATYDVTHALARNIDTFAWMPQGRSLLLEGQVGTHTVFWEQPLDGPAHRIALGGVEASSQFDVSESGLIAFVGATSTHPGELYVLDGGKRPRRLTDVNAFVDALELGRTETVDWKGPGGFDEDGVLTDPVGYRQGRTYPLVLVIHGGPEGASTVRFSALAQLLASAGFLVFQPNYRGSTNLGDAYQHAIYRDTGDGPGRDVMAGLRAVERRGMVDTRRIGISGWSYGGYMTAWLTGHEHVWKAAVCGAALTDWVMDYTIAYYQQGDTYFFGGSPWRAKDWNIWRDQSPIEYARSVTTPTLILGDVGDANVPLVNSYEWYHALKDNGVDVTFYAYPEDTHFPHDIVQTTDVYRRWIGWMNRYLR